MNVALDGDAPSEQQLKKDFESPKEEVKRMALKTLIQLMINGEKFPTTLMSVIRFVMPCKVCMCVYVCVRRDLLFLIIIIIVVVVVVWSCLCVLC